MKLQFRRFDLKLTRTWRIASGLGGEGTNTYGIVFVELSDDQGRSGIGEAASTDRYEQPVEVIEAFLRKVDASRLSFDDVSGSMKYLDIELLLNLAMLCSHHGSRPAFDDTGFLLPERKQNVFLPHDMAP